MDSPKTLLEAVQYFSDAERCRQFMIEVRWADGIVRCPICQSEKVTYLEKAKVYRCYGKHPKQKFSLKVGTVFEDSPIGLDKWLPAAWMLSNCRNGVSSYELSRSLGVTQKSAWFMLHRIRLAMKDQAPALLGGPDGGVVEVDESFVGGDPKNWHKERREKRRKEVRSPRVREYQNRFTHKTAIIGMIDRDSRKVRAKVVPNVKRDTLQKEILDTIEFGSKVYTDQAVSYSSLKDQYVHETVNHAVQYVNGQVHTNSLENFWSLMKRNLAGTYVAVEPFHLDRYLDEQVFRFNHRINENDSSRFRKVVAQLTGKRLTYEELTGKVGETAF
ncbi:MAG TPA: IS1595 family transposase [Candidatus Aquilonibacter sp.]|nr:IS1595 family transposase [Candidatus Aquilonibacter sp.]